MSDEKHKTFTLSVDLLLTIVLILSILLALAISNVNTQVNVLQEKVAFLEDHDIQMQQLKHDLFTDLLRNEKLGDK